MESLQIPDNFFLELLKITFSPKIMGAKVPTLTRPLHIEHSLFVGSSQTLVHNSKDLRLASIFDLLTVDLQPNVYK
jgi:hypothetical protein